MNLLNLLVAFVLAGLILAMPTHSAIWHWLVIANYCWLAWTTICLIVRISRMGRQRS